MEGVYEQLFFMKYSGNWSFTESYNLPLGLRNWFAQRLIKQLKDEAEAVENARSGNKGGKAQVLTPYNAPSPPAHMMSQKSRA